MNQPLRLLHLITSLDTGGAERILYQLISRMDPGEFDQRVVCLISIGLVGEQIRGLGIPVTSLGMRSGRPSFRGFLRLAGILRQNRPQILQTWLYHADLLGLLAGKLAHVPVILWNIRSSDMDFSRYRRLSRWVLQVCALLSRLPQAVVVNSQAGQVIHTRLGYHPRAWKFIPNGVDTQVFHPDPEARAGIRRELGLSDETSLVGMIARYDPMKGHEVFVRAAGEISRNDLQVHFLLAGQDVDHNNHELTGHIAREGLGERVHLLGPRNDVERIHAALDVLVSASIFGEGFSNVIAEAMACGVPCVVTDVGDSGRIAGETGAVVPPRDPVALAQACLRLLRLSTDERASLGEGARRRVVDDFGIEGVVSAYKTLYRDMAV